MLGEVESKGMLRLSLSVGLGSAAVADRERAAAEEPSRLIAIMDDPWWQRQVKPSHMWGGHRGTQGRDSKATFATSS